MTHTGWARGVDLHAKLTKANAKVRLRLPAVDRPKADLTDHVEAGLGLDELISVCVDEVATWHALTAVRDKAKLLQQAIDEAKARRELVENGQDVEDNRRFAKRWVLETQIRQEALRDLTDQVWAHGMRVGTDWAGEAMEAADRLLTEGTELARRCHLDLGVPVPESLRPATTTKHSKQAVATEASPGTQASRGTAPKASPTDVVTADSDAWTGQKGVGSSAPVFRVLDGQIVQWEPDRSSRRRREDWDEDEDEPGKFKVLLSTVVRVTCREYLEVEDDHDVEQVELLGRSSSRRSASARHAPWCRATAVPRPDTAELMEIRVKADQWHDHSWLESLPGTPDYDHKRAGLDQLQRAILAISENVADEVLYRATGWRENSRRHAPVHPPPRGDHSFEGHAGRRGRFLRPHRAIRPARPDPRPRGHRQAWLEALGDHARPVARPSRGAAAGTGLPRRAGAQPVGPHPGRPARAPTRPRWPRRRCSTSGSDGSTRSPHHR